MAKAVIRHQRRKNSKNKAAPLQLMQRPDGQVVRVLRLDPHSATFADDLTSAFRRNIAKARRENKRLFGSSDGAPAE